MAGLTPLDVLRSAYGPDAVFREGQGEAIEAVVAGRRTLVVQRTGWGKSLVYFVATKILREAGRGPTLLVSPLLALMRNQVDAAARLGLRAASLDSTNREAWADTIAAVKGGAVDVLLVSPERLGEPGFRDDVLAPLERDLGLLVIDEAHCVSDWGHDFRPDFRRILSTVRRLPEGTPVLATTATANDRVIADVRAQLGEIAVMRGPLTRESLVLRVRETAEPADRLAWLAAKLPRVRGSGIVYTLTIRDADRVAAWLRSRGMDAEAYSGQLPSERRLELEDRFRRNDLACLVATTALGMGYDKPDVAYVVHYQRPGSIIAYYQQIGRAGRDLPRAEVALLTGEEDARISEWFIESAFPARTLFDDLLAELARGPETEGRLAARVNHRKTEVAQALKIAEVEGAVRKERDGTWHLVNPTWSPDALPIERIGEARRREMAEMEGYVRTDGCRMAYLARALDDTSAPDRCGRCDRCAPRPEGTLDEALVAAARAFLRGGAEEIEPKKMFPPGAVAEGAKKMPEDRRNEAGIVLGTLGDGGWGSATGRGLSAGPWDDALVAAAVSAARGRSVEWVAWIPGPRNEEAARRIAAGLGVPAVECVTLKGERPDMAAQANASFQFAAANGAYRASGVPPGRGLLVDALLGSGWTLAAVGGRLRAGGASAVVPLALARRF